MYKQIIYIYIYRERERERERERVLRYISGSTQKYKIQNVKIRFKIEIFF